MLILNNYSVYKDNKLTSFSCEEWEIYQNIFYSAYPRNELIPLETRLNKCLKRFVEDEINMEYMIDIMNKETINYIYEIRK